MTKPSMFERVWNKKIVFFLVYFIIFTISYLILVAVDFLPEPPTEPEATITTAVAETETTLSDNQVENVTNNEAVEVFAVPLEITIERLNKSISVLNPESRTIADLDNALLSGVVRHPDSAKLGQAGNVFILGHSSYLPTVMNRNFQAFNGIQNLEWGDIIEVSSEDSMYTYRVEKVFKAKAQDVTVPIAGAEKLLTLATCNSFGSTDDRYVVEARQVDVSSI